MDYCALCGFPADDHWANCPNAPCPPPCPGPPILLGPCPTSLALLLTAEFAPCLISEVESYLRHPSRSMYDFVDPTPPGDQDT